MRRRRKIKELTNLQFALVLTIPVVIFLVSIIIYPLVYSIWVSFHEITFFGGFNTKFVGLNNYKKILESPKFWQSLIVSFRFTVESVVLTMLIGLGIALALSRTFPGRKIIRSLVILPWAVSYYGSGMMFKYLWRGGTGLPTALAYIFGFDTRINILGERTVIEALAIGNAWNLAPLVAFFLLANIETIPLRLYDMAEIDHMGPFRRFYYVTLPYLRFTLFVFTAICSTSWSQPV